MHQSIHFIGINDPILCNLAITLHQQGYQVSVSDDALDGPIQTQLQQANLLPTALGWFPAKLTASLNQVIINRAIASDNPELQKALVLGIKVASYAAYIQQYAKNKQRIVLTGGPATHVITALTMHVLHYWHRQFDYVLAQLIPSWHTNLQLSDAPVILLQADALPASALDQTPQFLTYQHNMAVMSGIGEERDSRYPTLDDYLQALAKLADATPKGGMLIYNATAQPLQKMMDQPRADVQTLAYTKHTYQIKNEQAYLNTNQGNIPIADTDELFLQAVSAAQLLVAQLGVDETRFYEAIPSFVMA